MAASATAIAAVRNASPNAGASPTLSRRAANSPARTSTPVTTPSVRARNAKPPATPCCAPANAPMICAMFGTWNTPRPKPAAKSATAITAALVVAFARLSSSRPNASSTSPATIGPRAPRRSAAAPATGAAAMLRRRRQRHQARRRAVDEAAREALKHARGEQETERRRETTERERDRREDEPYTEYPRVAHAVGERTAPERGHRVGEDIADDHPPHALRRLGERGGHGGKRDVDDRAERDDAGAGRRDPAGHGRYDGA